MNKTYNERNGQSMRHIQHDVWLSKIVSLQIVSYARCS